MRLPNAESSVTQHRLSAGGKSFDYTATAGTLIIRDDEDKPIASMGYIAYVRHDLKGSGRAAADVRVQRRTGILVAVAAHGRVGTQARRGVRSGSNAGGPRIVRWTTNSGCSTRATW